ncbi:hypothetical protein Tco_1500996 [Tanacetum coccineum]
MGVQNLGQAFTIDGTKCPMTRITSTPIVPPKKTSQTLVITSNPEIKVIQIVLWFRNDHVATIMSYGDYEIRNVMISRVNYVEGLGHNLFSVGQFYDFDLKVAFENTPGMFVTWKV